MKPSQNELGWLIKEVLPRTTFGQTLSTEKSLHFDELLYHPILIGL